MYSVRKWNELYEVNDKNQAWREGQKRRVGALEYVRLRVNGTAWSEGWREFLRISGKDSAMAFGIFCKMLELAADRDSNSRGMLLDRHGKALDADGIARLSGFRSQDVVRALSILTNPMVNWVENIHSRESPGKPGNSLSDTDTESDTESDNKPNGNPRGNGDAAGVRGKSHLALAIDPNLAIRNLSEDAQKKKLWARVEAIQPEGPWREWWRVVVGRIWKNDKALSVFHDCLQHVEDSMSERTRQAKGRGPTTAPGALLGELTRDKACLPFGIRWPKFPEKVTP